MIESFNDIFRKNILKLREEIQLYKDEDKLWHREKNIANPAGNLCLHLIGNLNTFIGVALGSSDYVRNRELEFSQTGVPKEKLLLQIDDTLNVVTKTLAGLPAEKLNDNFPVRLFETDVTVGYMLIHLSAHLTYHLGQINYHRRLLDA